MGARPTQTLHYEIESARRLLTPVVVDRHAHELSTARISRLEAQDTITGRQIEHRTPRAIRNAYDDCVGAAVVEKVLNRKRYEAVCAVAAESAPILVEGTNRYRLIGRPTLGSTDESDHGRTRQWNGAATVNVSFCPNGNEVERFGRHTGRDNEKD